MMIDVEDDGTAVAVITGYSIIVVTNSAIWLVNRVHIVLDEISHESGAESVARTDFKNYFESFLMLSRL